MKLLARVRLMIEGHPHVLLMHERLIEHINKHEGIEWVTVSNTAMEIASK